LPLQLPSLQLPPLQLPPLQLRPLQLRYVPDVPRLNVDPPRLNVCPPRGDIELKCPPCPPPPRGAAFTADAVNVAAAKQLKNSMSFAFIDYLVVYILDTPKREESRYFPACH
jgi:hypothetical protein